METKSPVKTKGRPNNYSSPLGCSSSSEKGDPFCPARLHQWASSLAKARTILTFGVAPLKTQSFLCRQMLQAPRMTREFRPFLRSPLVALSTFLHHSSKE